MKMKFKILDLEHTTNFEMLVLLLCSGTLGIVTVTLKVQTTNFEMFRLRALYHTVRDSNSCEIENFSHMYLEIEIANQFTTRIKFIKFHEIKNLDLVEFSKCREIKNLIIP